MILNPYLRPTGRKMLKCLIRYNLKVLIIKSFRNLRNFFFLSNIPILTQINLVPSITKLTQIKFWLALFWILDSMNTLTTKNYNNK